MAGQRKWGKNGYLEDFRGNTREGYTYTGEMWQADGAQRKRLLVKLWALQAVSLASVILPGLFTTAGLQNTFYVILPYVFWLIAVFYQAYVLGSMTFGGNPLRNYIYERTVVRFIPCAAVSLAGALLTAAGLLVFLAGGGGGEGILVCLLGAVFQGICSFLVKKCHIVEIWTRTGPDKKQKA